MTERDFEERLRHDFRQMVDEAAPPALRASVIAIPDVFSSTPQPRLSARLRFPRLDRFATVVLAATAVVVTLLIGIGLLVRSTNVGPSPAPGPTSSATAEPTGPLGGGSIIVSATKPSADRGTFDVFTLDAGTGEQTLLGELPPLGASYRKYNFQWGGDRKHVLITVNSGGGPKAPESLTDAGRELIFVCCEPPDEVLPGGATQRRASGWVLSPQSDRIAGLHNGQIEVPGCLLCSAPDAVVIRDVGGGNLRTLPLPDGTQGNFPISWAPDGSAVVISGCRPCNNSGVGRPGDSSKLTPTPAVEHAHLFIVPVDGSPVRELLDQIETTFSSAAWSPDGRTIAFARNVCPSAEHAPYCIDGTSALVTMTLSDGKQTVAADVSGGGLVWSPDGRRIAFADESSIFVMDADGSHLAKLSDGQEPRWSPDSEWLLFIYDQTVDITGGWIIPADGGEPRLLGPYGGWAW